MPQFFLLAFLKLRRQIANSVILLHLHRLHKPINLFKLFQKVELHAILQRKIKVQIGIKLDWFLQLLPARPQMQEVLVLILSL